MPPPFVHPDLAALASLAATDEDRTATGLEVSLIEIQRLADPESGPPHHDDESPQPTPMRVVSGLAEDPNDLFDPRRVRGISPALVARRAARVETGLDRR